MGKRQYNRLHWLDTFGDTMFKLGITLRPDYKNSYVDKIKQNKKQSNDVLNFMQHKK